MITLLCKSTALAWVSIFFLGYKRIIWRKFNSKLSNVALPSSMTKMFKIQFSLVELSVPLYSTLFLLSLFRFTIIIIFFKKTQWRRKWPIVDPAGPIFGPLRPMLTMIGPFSETLSFQYAAPLRLLFGNCPHNIIAVRLFVFLQSRGFSLNSSFLPGSNYHARVLILQSSPRKYLPET